MVYCVIQWPQNVYFYIQIMFLSFSKVMNRSPILQVINKKKITVNYECHSSQHIVDHLFEICRQTVIIIKKYTNTER